jgi:hypothetical protein
MTNSLFLSKGEMNLIHKLTILLITKIEKLFTHTHTHTHTHIYIYIYIYILRNIKIRNINTILIILTI